LCVGLVASVAHGVYLDPTAKTNVNKQTDLFESGIEDYSSFESQIDSMKQKAIDGIGDPGNIELISDKSSGEIEEAAGNLSAIKANDLHSRGREEVMKTDIMEELHVDYTKPLNTQHRKDALKIADASAELLGNLAAMLKDLGIDCKTVKGNKIIEPEYYIDVKKEQTKDTVYNKTLCEELRNKYNCTDTLSMSCKTKVMQWEDWQDRTIDFGGADIYWNLVGWMYSYKWDDSEFGLHIKQEPHVMADIGREIAKRIGATTDQVAYVATIMPPLHPFRLNTPGKGFGEIFHLEKKSYTWEIFKFSYKYREGKLVCGEWNEDWTEECKLQ
jgi:hypothetical protein